MSKNLTSWMALAATAILINACDGTTTVDISEPVEPGPVDSPPSTPSTPPSTHSPAPAPSPEPAPAPAEMCPADKPDEGTACDQHYLLDVHTCDYFYAEERCTMGYGDLQWHCECDADAGSWSCWHDFEDGLPPSPYRACCDQAQGCEQPGLQTDCNDTQYPFSCHVLPNGPYLQLGVCTATCDAATPCEYDYISGMQSICENGWCVFACDSSACATDACVPGEQCPGELTCRTVSGVDRCLP